MLFVFDVILIFNSGICFVCFICLVVGVVYD